MSKLLKIAFFTLCCSVGFADAKKANTGVALAKEVISEYQRAGGVTARVQKTVTNSLLEEKTVSDGELILSRGRLNLNFAKPNASRLIMNAEMIWLITPGISEKDNHLQVLKIKSKDFAKQTKAPIALLLGRARAWDNLKVKSEETVGNVHRMKLVPIKPQALGDILEVGLEIDKQSRNLKALSFHDELDNVTEIKFSELQKTEKPSEKDFTFVPPKNADVTEYN